MSIDEALEQPVITPSPRLRPRLTSDNRFFWTSGADGRLRFLCCDSCQRYQHPPTPICAQCLGRDLTPQAVSGLGTVVSFTINYQVWNPDVPVPYAIVLVEIDEQPGLRLVSNLVGAEADAPSIGMRVAVQFEQITEEIFIPLFAAVGTRSP